MNQINEVISLPTSVLDSFPNHPFYVKNDSAMQQLTNSIEEMGVLVPIIVRETDSGRYQIISGHRRVYSCRNLKIDSLPAIIRNVNDCEATCMMVDSNFQREKILPSEKARAYFMKLNAIKCQGARRDLSSDLIEQKYKGKTSREIIAENSPDSSAQIWRFIRLNYLIPRLLEMVDKEEIAISPAVELSFLNENEQSILLTTIESEEITPSLSQALRMKNLSEVGLLSDDMIFEILSEQKKPDRWNLILPMNRVAKYFPQSYTPQKMEETIFRLLDKWKAVQIKKQPVKGGKHDE